MMIFRILLAVALMSTASQQLTAGIAADLKNLTQLTIVAEALDADSERLGLTTALLESQALVAVKRDMPKIIVKQTASYIYIRVTTIQIGSGNCAVSLEVQLYRPVSVLSDDGMFITSTLGAVWEQSAILSGSDSHMQSRVLDDVSAKITSLAADYYKANP